MILGGAKVSDKIAVIENLMNVANVFIIGGGMAYTFLKAQGVDVGKSLVEEGKIATAKRILEKRNTKGFKFYFLKIRSLQKDSMQGSASRREEWRKMGRLDGT